MEEREPFGTCSWCNKKDTVITCASCGCGVRYGDTYPSKKIEYNLCICRECYKKEEECEK